VDLWFHVPSLCWNPYHPNMRRLNAPDSDVPDEFGILLLSATHEYFSTWEFASCLHSLGATSWRWCCYELHDSLRPLVELDPMQVRVVSANDIEESAEHSIKARQKRPRTNNNVWEAALAEVPGLSGDEREDDFEAPPPGAEESDGAEDLAADCINDELEGEGGSDSEIVLDDDLRVDGDELLRILARWEAVRPEAAADGPPGAVGDDGGDAESDAAGGGSTPSGGCSLARSAPSSASSAGSSSSPSSPSGSSSSRESEGRRARRCDDYVVSACGEIRFYEKNLRVVAHCPCHTNCVRSRSFAGSLVAKRAGQGRPLGFLARWLEMGAHLSAYEHNRLQPGGTPFEERLDARERLEACNGSDRLFRRERPLRDDEGKEPDVVP